MVQPCRKAYVPNFPAASLSESLFIRIIVLPLYPVRVPFPTLDSEMKLLGAFNDGAYSLKASEDCYSLFADSCFPPPRRYKSYLLYTSILKSHYPSMTPKSLTPRRKGPMRNWKNRIFPPWWESKRSAASWIIFPTPHGKAIRQDRTEKRAPYDGLL